MEPGPFAALLVPVLLASGYVMDSVDGQLARLRGGGSVSGEWLDHTVDCVKSVSLHLAVLISWYRFPPVDVDWALLVPIAYQVVDVTTFFGLILVQLLRPAGSSTSSTSREHPIRKWLLLPTDYGLVCWTFLLIAWPPLFFAGYSLLMLANAALLILALAKWWRELRAYDQQAITLGRS